MSKQAVATVRNQGKREQHYFKTLNVNNSVPNSMLWALITIVSLTQSNKCPQHRVWKRIKEFTLPNNEILDWSKLKAFADDKMKLA